MSLWPDARCRRSVCLLRQRGRFAGLMVVLLLGLVTRASGRVLTPPPTGSADSIGYVQEAWTTDDGLPQNSITAICRTADGYLWLGTFDGLVRFDGVEFTVFNRSNTPGLGSNRIIALSADRTGRLWIGTEGGGLTRMQGGRFTTFTRADGLPADVVLALVSDRLGRLWIGTQGGGLVRYDHDRFTAYTTRDGLGSNIVGALVMDSTGAVWAGAANRLTRVAGDRMTHTTLGDKQPDRPIMSLSVSPSGGLWIGTAGDGIVGWRTGRQTTYTRTNGLPSDVIEDISTAPTGRSWVATGAGLALIGPTGRLRPYPLRDRGAGKRVLSVYEDVEGSVWIGTDGGGLVRMKPAAIHVYTRRDGLRVDPMLSITESRDGSIWVGTNCGGLSRIDSAGVITTFDGDSGLGNNCIWSVLEDEQGTIWAGSYGAGLYRREPSGRFTRFTEADGLPGNVVLSLARARGGGLWIGTYNGGFARYRDGSFKTYSRANGLPSNWVRAVVEDAQGIVWVATSGGLARLDRSGAITAYTTHDGLGSNDVRALYADSTGAVWVGTYGGGLSRLKNDRIVTLTRREGLFDDVISLIQPDHMGNVWMTSNRGLSRVRASELSAFVEGRTERVTSFAYGTADGLPKAECNGGFQPSGWLARDGRLWFPTVEGVGVIDPARISTNPHPPPVAIQSAQIDDLTLPAGDLLTLDAGQRRFELHYTALSLLAASRVRFRYRLEGLERDWIEAGTRRIAYYTNVPPGRYTFHVLAANNDGVWNERGTSLPIVVRAHFYETPLFLALCTLLILGICIVGYLLRVRNIAANEKRLELLVEKRSAELVRVTDDLLASEMQSRQWTETLYNLTNALSATLDRDEVLDRLLTYLEQAVPFSRAAVGFGRGEAVDEVVAWPGLGGGERSASVLGSIDAAMLGELTRTRQAIRLLDGPDGTTRLAVPLVATRGDDRGRSSTGVVLLERVPEATGGDVVRGRFSDEEVEIATAFATQAMTAIENARLFGDVQRLATVDGLTEVINRRHFFELAELECERARRYERPLAVLMLDIDHFKAINDTHGHAVGDQVLRAVAAILRQRLRQTEVVGRYGGEEFAIILPETSLVAAERLAERLRMALSANPVATEAGPIDLTASFGVAALHADDPAGAVALMKLADGALYEAKRTGRNRVCVHRRLTPTSQPEPV